MPRIIKVTPDNKMEVIELPPDMSIALGDILEDTIGGYPEMVRARGLYLGALKTRYENKLGDRPVMAVDEDGLYKEDLLLNPLATYLYNYRLPVGVDGQPIVGTVVFLWDTNRDLAPIPDEKFQQFHEELSTLLKGMHF